MSIDATSSPSKITVKLQPLWRDTDTYKSLIPPAKAIVQVVNPHHLIIQLLERNQPDQFQLLVPTQDTTFAESDFKVTVAQDLKKSFGILIRRKSTNEVLIDTTRGPLVLSDHYVEMTTLLPSPYVYGLASDRQSSIKNNFNFEKTVLYNRKGAQRFHPFYMGLEPSSGYAHGVFWDNSYPLEVQFSPAPAISFR